METLLTLGIAALFLKTTFTLTDKIYKEVN